MASWGSNVGRGSALRLRLLDFWRANQRARAAAFEENDAAAAAAAGKHSVY